MSSIREILHSPENYPQDTFFEEVAKIIGGDVTPKRVKRVVDISNNEGCMFHGIREESSVSNVQNTALLPLTPEGGMVSYWSVGKRVFGQLTRSGSLNTFDTTFFHYAHSHNNDLCCKSMTIIVTNKAAISRFAQVHIPRDDCVTLDFPISRNHFVLYRVEICGNESYLKSRTCFQKAEQHMFSLIEDSLLNGYELGKSRKLKISQD